MSENYCTFELTREERDWSSGYQEPVTRTYHVSVGEAEYIISTLQRQIPQMRQKNDDERKQEIAELHRRLKALGDC